MIKKFTCYDSINITFWKSQNYRDREEISGYQWLKIREGKAGGCESDSTREDLCGDKTVPFANCDGGYMNLQMW